MTVLGTLRRISTSPFSIDWDIGDFFNRASPYYESPLFISEETACNLLLYPDGNEKNNRSRTVELFLIKEDSFHQEHHHISFTMGIKLNIDTIRSIEISSMKFDGTDRMHGPFVILRPQLERWKKRASLLPNKIVTFFVKDLVHHDALNPYPNLKTQTQWMDKATSTDEILQVESSRSDELNIEKEGIEILSEKLKSLFLNGEGCDVTFKVENEEVRAHKSVLIAQSPVFASMFRHEMSETITGIVKIDDCTPDAFKALLLYLYAGTVEHLSTDIVYDLYQAAAKYDLEYLKKKCIKFMKNEVSSDTLCDTIVLCQKYKESELLQHVTNYFTEHAIDILLTMKWQLFMKEDPVTANELYIKAMQNK